MVPLSTSSSLPLFFSFLFSLSPFPLCLYSDQQPDGHARFENPGQRRIDREFSLPERLTSGAISCCESPSKSEREEP